MSKWSQHAPQQATVPVLLNTQVWRPPVATCTTPDKPLGTLFRPC